MKIKVLLVDDHPVVLEGLRAAVSGADLEVVAAVGTASEAALVLLNSDCDVALVDVRLPDQSGLEFVAQESLRAEHPAFIAISSADSPRYAESAFDAGAAGFLSKTTATIDLIDAIRRAAAGQLVFTSAVLGARRRPVSTLRPVDWRVVRQVIDGRGNDEIAWELGVSSKSVERSLTHLFAASGTTNRTELAIKAEREGWLDLPEAQRAEGQPPERSGVPHATQ